MTRGRVKGPKDATFSEKIVWILRIQDTKLEWARRTNGVVPNAAQWYRAMKEKFKRLPSYNCLRNYEKTLGRADVEVASAAGIHATFICQEPERGSATR